MTDDTDTTDSPDRLEAVVDGQRELLDAQRDRIASRTSRARVTSGFWRRETASGNGIDDPGRTAPLGADRESVIGRPTARTFENRRNYETPI